MKRLIPLLICILLLLGCEAAPANNDKTTEAAKMTEFSCDAVFFGDSITCDGNFDELFPELKIVNLGVYGDTIVELQARVPQVKAANPARIFLLGGINALRPDNVQTCLEDYAVLLDALRAACPQAELTVQSVLPVGAGIDDAEGSENEAVRRFNAGLKTLAGERGCAYVDLWSVYQKDGALDPALTRDGLHLNFTAYGPWADAVRPLLAPCPSIII